MKKNSETCKYTDEALHKDKKFILAILQKHARSLEHADKGFHNDKKYMLNIKILKAVEFKIGLNIIYSDNV